MTNAMQNLINRTYMLCIEQRLLASVLMEWIEAGKSPEILIRDAHKGIERSVVLVIKDKDGNHLSFIEKIARMTSARVHVK